MQTPFLLVLMVGLMIQTNTNAQTGFERVYEWNEVNPMNFMGAAAMTDSDITCSLYDSDECFLIRIDGAGNLEWARRYSIPASYYTNGGRNLTETNDGGIVAVGHIFVGSYTKMFVLKTDASGEVLWTKGYDAFSVGADDVVEDENGNLYVLASGSCSGGTFLVTKLDSDGDLIWSKTFLNASGSGWDMDLCADGNLVLCGYLSYSGMFLPALAKITPDGELLYGYSYPQTGMQYSMAYQVTELKNGNLVMSGYTAVAEHSSASVFVAMIDPDGNMLWRKRIGEPGTPDGQAVARGIVELPDGTILLTAETSDYAVYIDRLFLKIDTLGNLLHAHVSSVPEFDWAYNHKLVQTPSGSLYSVCSDQGLIVRKIPALYAMCSDSMVTPNVTAMETTRMDHASVLNYSPGTVPFSSASQPLALTTTVQCETLLGINDIADENAVSMYPNPSSGPITIHSSGGQLYLYDLHGALVFESLLTPGPATLALPLNSGTYIWNLISTSTTHSGKIILD